MTETRVHRVSFGPMANSVGRASLPSGRTWYQKNLTADRGYLEGSLYLGTASAQVDGGYGSFSTNVCYGMGYGVYGSTAEMLVVSKRAAEATARLWVVNLATNVVTAVQNTAAVVVTDLNASKWEFAQWENYIYAVNETDGVFRYKIGDIDTWEEVKPDTGVSSEADYDLTRPPYSTLQPSNVAGDVVQSNPYVGYTSAAIEESTGNVLLNCPPAPNSTRRHFAKVVFASNVDLSYVDFAAFEMYSPNSPFVNYWSGGLWITETATSAGDDEGDSGFMKGIMSYVARMGELAGYTGQQVLGLYAGADFSRLLPVSRRNAIRTLGFRFDTDGNYYNAQLIIRSIYLGGMRYNNLTRSINPETGVREYYEWDLEYAVCYYDTGTLAQSDASKYVIPKTELRGESPFPPENGAIVWPMGVRITLTLTSAFTGTYDKIRVYRRFWQQRGNADFVPSWRLVAEVNNTGTPTWEDTYRMTELEALSSGIDPQFGNIGLTLNPAAVSVWKGAHMVLGYDRKTFLSYGGQPHRYMAPPETAGFLVPDPDDPTLGATFFAFPNRADAIRGYVSEDPLFAIGDRGVTVVLGDSALDSSPPRRLPNSRGTLAKRSFCGWGGGAIVGSLDGLWFYAASRAFTGSRDSTYNFDELTKDIRKSWRDFVGTSYANMVVAEHQDEVYAFNGVKWLRLSRNRAWEYGEWPTASYTVEHAISTLSHGLLALVGPGYLCRIRDYRVDKEDSASSTPLGSTHSSWEWQSETFDGARRRIVGIKMIGSGTVTLTIRMYDGDTGTDYAFVRDSATKVWEEPVTIPPGHRYELKVTGGSNADTLEVLELLVEDHDPAWRT